MTSTNFQVGFFDNNKKSSKVLKPPGGGSSDIFGGENQSTPRTGETTTRRNRNADSHNRLFGEPARAYTPAKNHLKSNIPIGGDETDNNNKTRVMTTSSAPPSVKKQNGHYSEKTNGKMENGENGVCTNGKKDISLDGNPVTGEGYKPAVAEINTTIPSLNGTNQVIHKNRVPPGGYSSGLW